MKVAPFSSRGKVEGPSRRAPREPSEVDVTLRPARKVYRRRSASTPTFPILAVRDRELDRSPSSFDRVGPGFTHRNCGAAQRREPSCRRPRRASAGRRGVSPRCTGDRSPFASRTHLLPDTHARSGACEGRPQSRKRRACSRSFSGMKPRTFAKLDTIGYHAAGGPRLANGAAALAAIGEELLVVAGVPRAKRPRCSARFFGALRRTSRSSIPGCSTGPVRRGDAGAIERQIGLLA